MREARFSLLRRSIRMCAQNVPKFESGSADRKIQIVRQASLPLGLETKTLRILKALPVCEVFGPRLPQQLIH